MSWKSLTIYRVRQENSICANISRYESTPGAWSTHVTNCVILETRVFGRFGFSLVAETSRSRFHKFAKIDLARLDETRRDETRWDETRRQIIANDDGSISSRRPRRDVQFRSLIRRPRPIVESRDNGQPLVLIKVKYRTSRYSGFFRLDSLGALKLLDSLSAVYLGSGRFIHAREARLNFPRWIL